MHWHNAAGRKQVVECREDSLLHFAGIRAPADQHDLAREIEGDHSFTTHAVAFGASLETRAAKHCEFGNEFRKVAAIRADQQVPDKERVPSLFREDSGSHFIAGISACQEILGIQCLPGTVRNKIVQQRLKLPRRHLSIIVPPDGGFCFVIEYNVFVLRTTASVCARFSAKRAA